MTGRYPVRYGFQYDVIHMGAPWGLPLTEKVCEHALKYRGTLALGGGVETNPVSLWEGPFHRTVLWPRHITRMSAAVLCVIHCSVVGKGWRWFSELCSLDANIIDTRALPHYTEL